MASSTDDKNFETRWLHESTAEHQVSVVRDLAAIKNFAYNSFDRLDMDGNGYLEPDELTALLEGDELNNREKSFVMFLLNNCDQISIMHDDGVKAPVEGISRDDLELYFKLIANLL